MRDGWRMHISPVLGLTGIQVRLPVLSTWARLPLSIISININFLLIGVLLFDTNTHMNLGQILAFYGVRHLAFRVAFL